MQEQRLEQVIYFLLDRTIRKARQYSHHYLQKNGHDTTLEQWVVLKSLDENPGISQKEIGTRTFKDAPTVTRILDLLAKKGLVERRPNPNDRRKFEIHLTEAGQELVVELTRCVIEIRETGIRGIDHADLEAAKRVLDRIFDNFE